MAIETLYDFTGLAQEYRNLGWAVIEQLDALLDGERLPSNKLNPNAVRMIVEFLDLARDQYDIREPDLLDANGEYDHLLVPSEE